MFGHYLFWFPAVLLFIIPFWRILRRAGFGGPLALLWLVPVLGPAIIYLILAFGRWSPEPPFDRLRAGGGHADAQ